MGEIEDRRCADGARRMRRMETSGNKTGRGKPLSHVVTFSCILVTPYSSLEKYERLFFFFLAIVFSYNRVMGIEKGRSKTDQVAFLTVEEELEGAD